MLLMGEIYTRRLFGELLNCKGLLGEAIEIGTHRGEFARALWEQWQGKKLHCVDPWQDNLPGYEVQGAVLWGGAKTREEDYQAAKKLLQDFSCSFLRMTSQQAVAQFADNSLCFVYVDGNHESPHPSNDLRFWYPKLIHGGIMAGHDFICPGEPGGGWGKYIQPAVLNFAGSRGVDVYLLTEENGLPWSFYFYKSL